jgi:tetratricopeptide (TPR) repeat protein
MDDYNNAIRINPDFAPPYFNRGNLYNNLGQYQLAIEDFNNTIRLSPDYAMAYNSRAIIYLNHGNKIIGCRNAQKACALGNCATLETAKVKGYCN